MSLRDDDLYRGLRQNPFTLGIWGYNGLRVELIFNSGPQGLTVNTILVMATLLLTVSLALALGVATAYAAVYGVLRAMNYRSSHRQTPPTPVAQAS